VAIETHHLLFKLINVVLVVLQKPMFMFVYVLLPNIWITQVQGNAFHPWINAVEARERPSQTISCHFHILWIDFYTRAVAGELLAYT